MIYFTKHAKEKFYILQKHKFHINKEQVLSAVLKPDLLDCSRLPLFIAQKKLNQSHVLRVVFKKDNNNLKIIAFYPGRIKKYAKQNPDN